MTNALPKRVMAIVAHPDDVELLCAGTLAKFRQHGADVAVTIACRGDRGGGAASREELAGIREAEATEAARLLGAEIHFLRLSDAEVWDDVPTRQLFLAAIRNFDPELIVTHSPTDYHQDHRNVSALVSDCSWYAASPGHHTLPATTPVAAPVTVLYCDNVAAMNFEPSHLVDISSVMELKLAMLRCHRSQLARQDSGMDQLVELATTQARLRGMQCGVQYAEGFAVCMRFGRRRPEPLLP